MTRDEMVALLDEAVTEHEKIRYYQGEDMLGPLEFYIPKFSAEHEYLGVDKKVEICWGHHELGAVLW
jgi:hypothetical protein